MSTTYTIPADASFSAEGMDDNFYVYTRWGNPTIHQLEEKLAILEGAENALAFATGMGASSALLFHTLKAGDHIVISDVTYAAVSEMTNELVPGLGVEITKVDTSDLNSIEKAIKPNTKLVYIETPCNPLLRLTDITAVALIAHSKGAKLAVDSTFATPVSTNPIQLGADFVIHSLTKYLCGHGDALGGVIIGKREDLAPIRKSTAIRLGATLSPFNAWLIMRGIATLPLRMRVHQENALAVASWLEKHPNIRRVLYPGLPSHPQHELAKKQMRNFSGMITFQTKEDGNEVAKKFVQRLKVIHYAVSLGHHRSLVMYMHTADLLKTSFKFATKEQEDSYRVFAGDGMFRFSVGLEDWKDIIDDLDQALK